MLDGNVGAKEAKHVIVKMKTDQFREESFRDVV